MEPSYQIDAEAMLRFEQLRGEAVARTCARVHASAPEHWTSLGETGRRACREDLELQLEFLRAALELGALEPFLEFQRWYADVAAARKGARPPRVETLGWLAEVFEERMDDEAGRTIGRALRHAASHELAPREPSPRGEAPSDAETSSAAPWPQLDAMVQALLAGDRRRAQALVTEARAQGKGLVEIDVHLLQAALYEVGARWQRAEVSVAQEHLATATARTVMAEAFVAAELPPLGERRAILACVEGNHHSVGLQMVADALELEGWDVHNLGADTPVDTLIAHVVAARPHLVGLSISFAHQLGAARRTIQGIRAQLGADCPRILVGGSAVNQFGGLAAAIGADGLASDALQARTYAALSA